MPRTGLHKAMFGDLHRLDMALLTWTAENASSSEHPWGGRWKAGNAQARSLGSAVLLGCTVCGRYAGCRSPLP